MKGPLRYEPSGARQRPQRRFFEWDDMRIDVEAAHGALSDFHRACPGLARGAAVLAAALQQAASRRMYFRGRPAESLRIAREVLREAAVEARLRDVAGDLLQAVKALDQLAPRPPAPREPTQGRRGSR